MELIKSRSYVISIVNSSQGSSERKDVWISSRSRKLLTGNSLILFFSRNTAKIFLSGAFLSGSVFALELGRMPKQSLEQQYQAVGEAYEALMLQRLYEQMRSSHSALTDGDDNPFAPSAGEKIFQSMLNEEVLKGMAARAPLGVKDLVVRQLKGQTGVPRAKMLK